MNTQDEALFSDDDDDDNDDEVQKLLLSIQARKEKQQKLKKQIREKVSKSQKFLRDQAEQSTHAFNEFHEKIKMKELKLKNLKEKLESFPDIVFLDNFDMISQTRNKLKIDGEMLLVMAKEIEEKYQKEIEKEQSSLFSEAKRSRNNDVVRSLNGVKEEIEKALNLLKSGTN